MELKEQIQALIAVQPMTAATIARIKELISDPSEATTKAVQAFHNHREIANLKATISNLKSQLQPANTPADSEQLLDDLYQLQQKRIAEITQSGFSIRFGTSEKSFPCLQADEKSIHVLTGTPAAIGSPVIHDNELLGIITGTTAQAGRIKCTLWKPKQTAITHEKTATATGWNLRKSGASIPCQFVDNTLTTFAKSFSAGTILQCSGSFYEVLSSTQVDMLVRHKLAPYGDKQAPDTASRFKAPTTLTGHVIN